MVDQLLLTPDEAAELLRVASGDVIAMIEAGDLAGLKVAGQWRLTSESVKDFVVKGLKKQNLKALERAFSDQSRWARIIEEDPKFAQSIADGNFEPNSMGAFLQEVLRVSGASKEGKVVPIRGKSGEESDS